MRNVILMGCVLAAAAAAGARANTIFVGIGNDAYKEDLQGVANTIAPYASTVITEFNQNQGILTALADGASKLTKGAPDVLILYYRGHGGERNDPGNKGEKDLILGTQAALTPPYPGNPVTDDQLTAAISKINGEYPSAGIMIVLDSCNAGLATDVTDLASVDAAVIGASRADQCASGSGVLAAWEAALAVKDGKLAGDSNKDGKLTLGEFLDFLTFNYAFYRGDDKGTPFFINYGSNNLDTVVATAPEPSAMLLVLGGCVLMFARWSRPQYDKKQAGG